MKITCLGVVLVVGLMFPSFIFAESKSPSVHSLRQQMTLFGLYNYGINQELSKANPDLAELQFLAESALEVANESVKLQINRLHHQNYKEFVGKLEKLKTLSQKRKRIDAILAAKEVMQACSQCHMAGN